MTKRVLGWQGVRSPYAWDVSDYIARLERELESLEWARVLRNEMVRVAYVEAAALQPDE